MLIALCMFEKLQKLCIMENERDLLEYERKDVEKKLADQKADSELLRGQLRVCCNILHMSLMNMCHLVFLMCD